MQALMLIGLIFCLRGNGDISSSAISPAILNADYPRAFFFRKSETTITQIKGTSYENWNPAFSRLMGIMGKALDEEIPKAFLSNSIYFNRFKQEHPDQLVMLHYDASARDPLSRDTTDNFFPGHWIYFAAINITGNVPAQTNDTVISMAATNYFELNTGRYTNLNSDIVLYNLKPDGTPDWAGSEQVKLLAVNGMNKTITVQRGRYGTVPKTFVANNARAAAHKYGGPWSYDTGLLWCYNFSTACPTDAQGKTCADVLIDDLAPKFRPGGLLEDFDGIEFDAAGNYDDGWTSGQLSDMDNDGVNEGGIINGVNTYGIGVIDFYRKLKEALGPNRLLMADGGVYLSQRAFGILNGIETEGFPTISSDTNAITWATGLNFQNFWSRESSAPAFNYINYKTTETNLPFSRHRLTFAAAQCIGAAVTWSLYPVAETNDPIGIGIWDEMKKGVENQIGWLGQPQGVAVHLASQTPDLLIGVFATNSVVSNGYRFVTQAIICTNNDLLVMVRARCDPLTGYPASYARLLRAYIAPTALLRPLLGSVPHYIPMSWVGHDEFESVFYFRDLTNSNVSLTLEFEGTNSVTVDSIKAYGFPDVMYRVFKRGLVLVNPSFTESYTFDLQTLTPGRTYRRLQASSMQDTQVNNGSAAGSQITLGPLDGLFLIRSDIEDGLMAESFAGSGLDSRWTLEANATALFSNSAVTLVPPGLLTGQRAFIFRDSGSDGCTTNSAGAKTFNFYDHQLTIDVDLGQLSGTPDVGKRISYFTGVCYDSTASERAPQWAEDGVFFQIEKINTGGVISFRLAAQEQRNGNSKTTDLGELSAEPEGIEVILNGNIWAVTLTGSAFTNGTSIATGTFESVQESDFTDFYFSTGLVHENPALDKGRMEIRNINISTIPRP